MKIMAKIKFLYSAFIIFIIVAFLMIPLIAIFKKQKSIIIHRLNRLILLLIGGKLSKVGDMDSQADMLIMNHQGIVDIIGLEALQKNHLRWVAKKELFAIPYIGNLLRLGEMIPIDRNDKRSLPTLIKEIRYSLDVLGRQVAIFPEGTRAKGQKLLSFKAGTKMIAEKLNLKVQPVVITGSKMLFDEGGKTGHSSTVVYHFLPTIDVANAGDEWYDDVAKKMQEIIDDEFIYNHRSR
ncbi:MAG: lysophospholipid acyltransferase family protein [Sulfurovaceae bacterium]|nr:lysophospholipid acyltransferase family protein [Sulfurovaceae bacterium]